jgi:hypothetical protein
MASGYITERDVREEMRDRSAAEHLVLTDVAFTSEDISHAMRKTARRFNSLRPYCLTVTPETLSGNIQCFYDGIAWALLEGMRLNAGLNDMDYSAGNVQASVQGKLIENLDRLLPMYEKRFVEEATAIKIAANLSAAFGQIG